jgi:transposase
MINRTIIALDLAKDVIQACKISKHGEKLFNKPMKPKKISELLANTAPCIIAMEGCGSFHHWGRIAQKYGHEVKGMPANKVKPYISAQKTDANDAMGIAVASSQLNMIFSPVKSIEQQSLQSIRTSRKFLDKTLSSTSNNIRGLCYEYGIRIGKGKKNLREGMAQLLCAEDQQLPVVIKSLVQPLWDSYKHTDEQLEVTSKILKASAKQSEPCQRLTKLEGIGPICAVGLVSSLGDGSAFKNGRSASAYIGATPKQHSSGGKVNMIGIVKSGGDRKLMSNLFEGAMSVISKLPAEPKTAKQEWLLNLVKRAGVKRTCIALVNKNIRTAWALLRHGTEYKPQMISPSI